MKAFVFALLTAFLVLGLTAGDFHRGGLTDDQFQTLSERLTSGKRTVDDGIPRVAICWDDATARQFTLYQIRQFTSRGIPVSLAVIGEKVGTDGYSTWDQIRTEMDYAADNGVDFEICDHSKTHLYDAPEDLTYPELIDELDSSEIIANLGVKPKFFRAPGLTVAQAFYQSNRNSVIAVLDSLGYEYSDMGYTGKSMNGMLDWSPTYLALDALANPTGCPFKCSVPGLTNNGLYLPGANTVDYNMLFERDGTCGTSVSAWTIDSKGGTATTDWNYTFSYFYSFYISAGFGGIWALHDSVNADNLADPAGTTITAGANAVGAFSPTYMAEVCSLLQDKGYIKFVTASEYGDWVTSKYASGVDLMGNGAISEIPQFEIGDTSGVHIPWIVRGGTSYSASSNWPAATGWSMPTAIDAEVDYHLDTDDAKWPLNNIGDHIAGYRGKMGAFRLTTDNSFLNVMRTMLPPGRYSFSWSQDSHQISFEELHVGIAGQYFRVTPSAEQQYPAYGDTLISLRWRDEQEVTAAGVYTDGEWWTMHIDFVIPRDPPGEDFANAIFGSETMIDGVLDQWWLDQWWGGFSFKVTNYSNPVMSDFHLYYYPLD